MRINFYRFAEETTPRERALIYKQVVEGKHYITEISSDVSESFLQRHFPRDIQCSSLKTTKKLLKDYGGYAYTEHIDIDGVLLDRSPITLTTF